MSIIRKFTFYTLSFLVILSTVLFVPNNAKASICSKGGSVPMGFVTMNIQIEDLSSGTQGGGFATSTDGSANSSMNYTEGGDVIMQLTGGGNSQADYSVHVTVSGFNSDEGSSIEFDDNGARQPGFVGTFHNFHANTITASATQCPDDTATVYLTMYPISNQSPSCIGIGPGSVSFDYIYPQYAVNSNEPFNIQAGISWNTFEPIGGSIIYYVTLSQDLGGILQYWTDSAPGGQPIYSIDYYVPNGITTNTHYTLTASFDTQFSGHCTVSQDFTVMVNSSFTCTVTQATATVDPGGSTSYTINTTAQGGFNSPVTFSTGFSPSSGTPPTVTSYGNNSQAPPATTTVNIGTTTNTTAGPYTLTFTGTGGGQTSTCNTQLVVNPSAKDFQLTIAPSTTVLPNGIGTNTNPNRSNIGVNVIFDVFANCTGGFTGPITAMTASTTFTGPTLTLGATQLNCGSTTTLTVGNTASIPTNQQSVMPYNIFPQDIRVTGSGQL